jgi:hypothetical protein
MSDGDDPSNHQEITITFAAIPQFTKNKEGTYLP